MHLVGFIDEVLIGEVLNKKPKCPLLPVAKCELAFKDLLGIPCMSRAIDVAGVILINEMLEERGVLVHFAHQSIGEIGSEHGGPCWTAGAIKWLAEWIFSGIIVGCSHC